MVLLCTQDLSGTLGFVLNHGTGRHARDAVAGVPRALGTLRRGGPLGAGQGAVLYRREGQLRFTTATLGAHFPDEGWANPARVADEGILAVLLGYAAWSPGQLEEEIQAGAWVLTDVPVEAALAQALVKTWPR